MWAEQALERCIALRPRTVLDVGCGPKEHARAFEASGAKVTTLDINADVRPDFHGELHEYARQRSLDTHDLVWCSHVLEHQTDVAFFLSSLLCATRPGGWTCVTVPPAKPEIVGGHVSIWNMGLLLYNLVLAGYDCSQARGARYGYNISVLVQRPLKPIQLPSLAHDQGDILQLSHLFPPGCRHEGFNGDIERIGDW